MINSEFLFMYQELKLQVNRPAEICVSCFGTKLRMFDSLDELLSLYYLCFCLSYIYEDAFGSGGQTYINEGKLSHHVMWDLLSALFLISNSIFKMFKTFVCQGQSQYMNYQYIKSDF